MVAGGYNVEIEGDYVYAIIREGNGAFYTSMVFGYYKTSQDNDYKNRFWIVLNKEKTALIKQPVLQPKTKYLIPMVLVTDADESNWNKISEIEESVDFLPTKELPSLIDKNSLPIELTQKCIDMDSTYNFQVIRTITTPEDIRDFRSVSGGLHDAYIKEMREDEEQLYLLFDGTWGCKIEVWFEGEVEYDTSSRNSDLYDPYWFGSTVTRHDGFVYLIDDQISVEEINSNYCWFKAKTMRYKVIPN